MQTSESAARVKRLPHVHSSVLTCELSIERSGQIFSKPRVMYLRLACGHILRKRSRRRFLRGESVVCLLCERKYDAAVRELELTS
jgi:hypothetical protein